MNSKFYVSFEAAKLLKEKGYRQRYHAYYLGDSNLRKGGYRGDSWYDSPDFYPAPTKSEVIDWLESKGIYISIYYKIDRYHYNVEYKNEHFRIEVCGSRETRLEAEGAAIIKALELL